MIAWLVAAQTRLDPLAARPSKPLAEKRESRGLRRDDIKLLKTTRSDRVALVVDLAVRSTKNEPRGWSG